MSIQVRIVNPMFHRTQPCFLAAVALAVACTNFDDPDRATGASGTSTAAPGTSSNASTTGSTSTSPSTTNSNPTSVDSTSDALPPGQGCCRAHAGAGCEEVAVQACVCDADPSCCAFDWNQGCAELAQSDCAATCLPDPGEPESSSTLDPGGTGPGRASAGSGESGSGSSGGEQPPFCCEPGGDGACAFSPTAECVCAIDDTCCSGEWTEMCVEIATSDCNACTSGDCCTPQSSAGCNDETVQACVCEIDDYCCKEAHDDYCAFIAADKCGACPGT